MSQPLALVEVDGNKTPVDEAEIRAALTCLVRNAGNMLRTSRETGIARSTLRKWRDNYAEAYAGLARAYAQAIDDALIESARQTAVRAMQKSGDLVDKIDVDADISPTAASAIAQRLATVAGIATDKSLLMQGRPTSIHAASSVEEDLRYLRSKAIDSEAEELPASEETASPKPT